MILIVGIGNTGQEYSKTRHNLGFMVLDSLAERWGVHFAGQPKLKAEMLVTMFGNQTIALAKPQTFVNLSGNSVQKIKNFYKLKNNDIWVVSDDLDLEFGKIRTRVGGSSGGHNGLKDIIENIGEDFVRIRLGIKNEALERVPAEKFVLEKFSKTEQEYLEKVINDSVDVIIKYLEQGDVEHESKSAI